MNTVKPRKLHVHAVDTIDEGTLCQRLRGGSPDNFSMETSTPSLKHT